LNDGELTATLSVTDAADNTGTVSDTTILDTLAPTIDDAAASATEANLGNTVSGTMAIGDDGTGVESIEITGPDGVTANGIDVEWSGSFSNGIYTLTGTAGGTTVATLAVSTAGAYTFTQSQALDHSLAGSDILALGFDVTATDGIGNASSAGLTINLADDVPVAAQPAFFEIDTDSATASGSFVESYGADGGYVSQLTVDGYTFSYDPDTDSVSATGSSELVVPFEEGDYDSASGELTIQTAKGETLIVNMQTGDYDYDASGANLLDPEPEAAPVVALGDNDSLLGLIGAEALGLVDFSDEQAFAATDANNDIRSVTVSLTAINVSLGAGFRASQALANDLGLSYSVDNLALLDFNASITVTATDGGTIDNQALNEFLGSVYFSSSVLNLGLASTLSISATDAENNTTTTSSSDLLSLGLLQSNVPDYLIQGTSAANTLTGTADNDRLYGYGGNDNLSGGQGNDLLRGGTGNDTLSGGDGNDILIGGAGNDTLTGGAGNDVLRWEEGHQGSVGTPANDTVTDFNASRVSGGGDVLDLGSLLQGEGKIGKNAGNLTNYLHFALVGTATLIYISSAGAFQGITDASAKEAAADQIITLQNVDLTAGGASDMTIIETLLTNGNLLVDDATSDTDLSGSVSTEVGAVISDNDGDTAGTSVEFDSTGQTAPAPDPDNVAPVVQANSASLLGIAGVDLLGLIDLGGEQDLFAADADGNLQSVTVAYQPLLSVSLTALEFTASQQMADELGLNLAFDNDPGLLGLVAPSASVTITAADGGTIDNLAVNELLGTVAFADTDGLLGLDANLQLSLLNAISINATDSDGRTATDSLGELADLDALTTLLGDNDNILEGTSGNETISGDTGSQRLYGYEGNDTLNGGDGNDLLRGGAGDDTLNGGAGNDLLIDGNGADTFNGGAGDDLMVTSGNGFASIEGGDGFDTLLLDGGIDLDMVNGDIGPIGNIERLDLGRGDNPSTATLSVEDVDAMTDEDNVLQVTGDEQDTLNIQGAISDGAVTLGGTAYDQYTFGDTAIQVEQDTVQVET
uniref:type I secretion C-terminal target domain-containing protein n=1 Tax=Salinicola halimionae TaxID=1949081 RepID=UPI00130068A9